MSIGSQGFYRGVTYTRRRLSEAFCPGVHRGKARWWFIDDGELAGNHYRTKRAMFQDIDNRCPNCAGIGRGSQALRGPDMVPMPGLRLGLFDEMEDEDHEYATGDGRDSDSGDDMDDLPGHRLGDREDESAAGAVERINATAAEHGAVAAQGAFLAELGRALRN